MVLSLFFCPFPHRLPVLSTFRHLFSHSSFLLFLRSILFSVFLSVLCNFLNLVPLSLPSPCLYLVIPFLLLTSFIISSFPLDSSSHCHFLSSSSLSCVSLPVIFVSFFLPPLSLCLSFVFFPCCVLMQNGMFYTSYVSTYPCLVK